MTTDTADSPDLLLCGVEGSGLLNLGHYRLGQLLLLFGLRLLCQPLLLWTVVEDGGHVLARGTACGVVVLPEHLEHGLVVRLLGVKHHLNRLGVVAAEGDMAAKTVG